MEAMAAFQSIQARRNELTMKLDYEIKQLRVREGTDSRRVGRLIHFLENARLENIDLIGEIQYRLSFGIDALASEASLLQASNSLIRRSTKHLVIDQLTDNMILHVIANHAAGKKEEKAFFTANSRDFGGNPARDFLRTAGVTRILHSFEFLENWMSSHKKSN